MTIEALQSELCELSHEDRRQVMQFLEQLEAEAGDEVRLGESIQDFKAGHGVSWGSS